VQTDPICGMKVPPAKAAATVEYLGTTYSFCGKGCAAKFQDDPGRFLAPKPAPAPPTPADKQIEYICPMDPEVHQLGPGTCPKCGMALEPACQSRQLPAKPVCGGGSLLHRHKPPLTRRSVVHFCSGAHTGVGQVEPLLHEEGPEHDRKPDRTTTVAGLWVVWLDQSL
jgi:YHS domain-containing protein